jgi:starvation-inducible outer membrane lipoprotein
MHSASRCKCQPMKRLLCVAFLALAGCAARLIPAGVSGNETFVTVSNVWNSSDALPYATKHCARYGKVPKMTHSEGYSVVFDCVTP